MGKIQQRMQGEGRPRIWMHCSSLGEFEQGRPVLEALRRQYPDHALIITFFSPSGYVVRRNYDGADYVFYLPRDSARNARKLMDLFRPSLAVFVKYDLWYFYLRQLKRLQTPVILISAVFRPSQGYFKWYGTLQRRMLQLLTHIFVQDEASVILLKSIGLTQVSLSGDTRFDRVLEAAGKASVIEKMERLTQSHKLLIAGSSWPEDERLLLDCLEQLPKDWKLVLVPHEIHESHIHAIETLFNHNTIRWTQWSDDQLFFERVLIVDTMGLLLKLYRYGRIAWIGGGLSSNGVHNVLEPAVYGLPCAFGPVYEKYLEAIALIEEGGAVACADAASLGRQLQTWIDNEAAYNAASFAAAEMVRSHAGATDQIMNYLTAKNLVSVS
jgi:3-deoxy-D-manno-octulosonic-acid transferase